MTYIGVCELAKIWLNTDFGPQASKRPVEAHPCIVRKSSQMLRLILFNPTGANELDRPIWLENGIWIVFVLFMQGFCLLCLAQLWNIYKLKNGNKHPYIYIYSQLVGCVCLSSSKNKCLYIYIYIYIQIPPPVELYPSSPIHPRPHEEGQKDQHH